MRRTINNNFVPSRRVSSWNRNQNTVKYKFENKFGPVTHTVFIALVITVLGLIYLTQAARITNYDYAAQRIDQEIAELTNRKQDLEIENARLTSLSVIAESAVAQGMTEPVDTRYVSE